jgi:hypothetical protein
MILFCHSLPSFDGGRRVTPCVDASATISIRQQSLPPKKHLIDGFQHLVNNPLSVKRRNAATRDKREAEIMDILSLFDVLSAEGSLDDVSFIVDADTLLRMPVYIADENNGPPNDKMIVN